MPMEILELKNTVIEINKQTKKINRWLKLYTRYDWSENQQIRTQN